ncbi:MAG: M20/M25/M40 family metallo-hydrolase [Dehalococcoidia bacterium]
MAVPPAIAARVAAVAARPTVRDALDWVARSEDVITEETIRVTEIPAPTFHESGRATYIAERLDALGLAGVTIAADGNVYGCLGGSASNTSPPLAIFVHMDTVFGHDVPVAVSQREGRLYAPGVGDNSAGLAGLLVALRAMQIGNAVPDRPVWIVATVGEEGLGNLVGATAATDRLGRDLEAVVAIEGSFFGRVSHTAVGSRRLRVSFHADGGHSWHDFGRSSAVHALVKAGAEIAALHVPSEPRTTFNIGEIRGGTGVNVIAECAEMVLDMRSISRSALDDLDRRVRRLLDGVQKRGVTVSVQVVGDRPAGSIAISHPLVQTCSAVLTHLGAAPQYAAASTDANVALGRGIPAVTLGVTRGGGAHTLGEWIEIAPMVRGVQQIILMLGALARDGDAAT